MLGLAFAALFILLNGFFVAAEFALVKLHATPKANKVKTGRDLLIQQILARLDRYLSVTQLGVTLASLGLGWIGQPALERVVSSITGGAVEKGSALSVVTVVIAFGLLTFSHVLFGELVPKLVAIQRSQSVARFSVMPLRIIFVSFRPLLWILEKSSGILLRMLGLKADAASEGTLSEEEILGILVANTARSPGGKARGELVERVIRFAQRTARHAMVPRVDVVSLPLTTPIEEAARFVRKHQYSRIVLTRGRSLDEVAGYLYAKDFLFVADKLGEQTLLSLRRDVLFVPEGRGLLDVLRDMQLEQVPLAIVVDEYGGTSGMVTMEDLLEEIVGEIRDELDEEPQKIVKIPGQENAWDVDAATTVDELKSIGIDVPDVDLAGPIGAVVLELLERVPRKGDKVQLTPNVTATVSNSLRRRITRVRVDLIPPPVEPE
ncbi:MAG: hemolysin family protein [Polyangiaceae bacterium]